MKSTSYSARHAPRSRAPMPQAIDLAAWFAKATSLLLLTIAMLALVALTACKDAGKTGAAGGGPAPGSPPLSAPPTAPPAPAPAAEAPAGGGMTAPAPSGAASATKP